MTGRPGIDRPFGVGVVGIGDISDVYIDNLRRYRELLDVVGCAGRDLATARQKADRHGLRRAYRDVAELFADPEVDIVLDLTVPAAHHPINRAALLSGKHVYSEKPLAATEAESEELLQLATERGLAIGCAPDTFLGARLQTVRRLIDDGRVGDVVGATAAVVSHGHEWHHPNPAFLYQPGAGPVMDIGPYYVTALLALLGAVDNLAAMAGRAHAQRRVEFGAQRGEAIPVAVDTHVIGLLRFRNGALATLIASFDVWDSRLPRLEFYGTRGTVLLPDPDPLDGPNLFGGPRLFRDGADSPWVGMPRRAPLPPWQEIPLDGPFVSTSHARNSRGIGLVDLALAVRDGREPRASGRMAHHAVGVMEGLLRSADEGRFVRVTTTFERPAPLPRDFPVGGEPTLA